MSTCAIAFWYNDSVSYPTLHKRRPSLHNTNTHPVSTAMPQYDAYEEPPALSPSRASDLGEGHDGAQPHVQGDGIYKIADHESENDAFHSAMSSHTHARHSSLLRTDSGSGLIPSTTHSSDPSSPKVLTAEESASLAAYTKAQADDDSIRLVLACQRCGQDLAKENRTNDIDEFAKEAHMLNGGWMHRSRASCELLADRPVSGLIGSRDYGPFGARQV